MKETKKQQLSFAQRKEKGIVRHTRFVPYIAATFALAACFSQAKPIQISVKEALPENRIENRQEQEPPILVQPQRNSNPATSSLNVGQPPTDIATKSADIIPPIVIDKPELATASFVPIDAIADAPASESLLMTGAIAAVNVTYLSEEATPTQQATLILQAYVPSSGKLEDYGVFYSETTPEGLIKVVSIPTKIEDVKKNTIRFTPKQSGLYALLPKEQAPKDKVGFSSSSNWRDPFFRRYDPAKDELVGAVTEQGFHKPINEYYFPLLWDEDIASFSVDFVHGDGGEEAHNNYHALRFFRYAFHHSSVRERVWKEVSPRVMVHNTRRGIDATAEAYDKKANVRIGFSRGALVLRANSAILREKHRKAGELGQKREYYFHFYGDISLAGAHLGIKAADPKWWRAGAQGRRYATLKQIAHAGFFHNLSTPLEWTEKGLVDVVENFNTAYLALGHKAFFPPPTRYPKQTYPFITMYAFGRFGGIPVPEILSQDDSYSLPCSAASDNFKRATDLVSETVNGECRYNFIEALERMEKWHGADPTILYGGYFSDIEELRRAQAWFEVLIGRGIGNFVWNLRNNRHAALVRSALAWLQSEQALMPYGELGGDGLPDTASALKYKGTEPLFVRNGNTIEINMSALEKDKSIGVSARRAIKNASHADFSGQGTDSPQEYSEQERAIYEQVLADTFMLRDKAFEPGQREVPYVYDGLKEYLGMDFDNSVFLDLGDTVRTDDNRVRKYFDLKYRPTITWSGNEPRIEHCYADFRWYNGNWWFDNKPPRIIWTEYGYWY